MENPQYATSVRALCEQVEKDEARLQRVREAVRLRLQDLMPDARAIKAGGPPHAVRLVFYAVSPNHPRSRRVDGHADVWLNGRMRCSSARISATYGSRIAAAIHTVIHTMTVDRVLNLNVPTPRLGSDIGAFDNSSVDDSSSDDTPAPPPLEAVTAAAHPTPVAPTPPMPPLVDLVDDAESLYPPLVVDRRLPALNALADELRDLKATAQKDVHTPE